MIMVGLSTKTPANVIVLVVGVASTVTNVRFPVVTVEISTLIHARVIVWAIGRGQHVKLVQLFAKMVERRTTKSVAANARNNAKMVAHKMLIVAAFARNILVVHFVVAQQLSDNDRRAPLMQIIV